MLKGEKLKVQLNFLTAVNCSGVALFVWVGRFNANIYLAVLMLSGLVSLLFGFITLITLLDLKDRENQQGISITAKRMQQLALIFYTFPVAYCGKILISAIIRSWTV